MSATLTPTRRIPTIAKLLQRLGDIPPERVRLEPAPGTATEADVVRFSEKDDTLYELVDGTLVEKAMGVGESKLGLWLAHQIQSYLDQHDLGELIGSDGFQRLRPNVVRAPDVTFCLWENTSSVEEDEANPIGDIVPDLAVEIVSRSNTPKELSRKRKEYFASGTKLVWQIYPKNRTVEVYTSPARFRTLLIDDTLDGGSLLPGFRLPLRTLFGRRTKPGSRRKK
jgi:Uma2 family endonuclease